METFLCGVCMLSSSLFCPGSIYWGMLSISERAPPLLKMALLLWLGWVVCQDHWPALSLMQSMDWPGTVPNTSLCEPQSMRWVEVYVSVETLLGVGRMAWGFVVGCCRVTAFYLIHLSSSTPCSQSLSSDSPFQMKASFALRYEKTHNTEKMEAGGGKL